MNTDKLVENCVVLTPREITKKILENSITETSLKLGPNTNIEYWQKRENDPTEVELSLNSNEPQTLKLEWQTITFGDKAYFKCECATLASKLYLPKNGKKFLCRKCHGLQYELSGFNKTSVAGKKLYQLNRLLKLSESRASMGRILYNGEYTKKFKNFIKLCDNAGFESIVQGADDLKSLINAENIHEARILNK